MRNPSNNPSKIREIEGTGHLGMTLKLNVFDEYAIAALVKELKGCTCDAPEALEKAINFLSRLTSVTIEENDLFAPIPEEQPEDNSCDRPGKVKYHDLSEGKLC